jgi:hypothetical protein
VASGASRPERPGEGCCKLCGINGLGQNVKAEIEPDCMRTPSYQVAAEERDLQARIHLAQGIDECPPLQAGHQDLAEHHVNRFACEQLSAGSVATFSGYDSTTR